MNLGSVSSITKSWCLQGLAFFYKVLIYKISVIVNLLCQLNYAVGGGLASNFAASNQIMGVRKTTDFLEKATWGLAAFVMVLCFVCAFLVKNEFKANDPYAGTQTEQVDDSAEE